MARRVVALWPDGVTTQDISPPAIPGHTPFASLVFYNGEGIGEYRYYSTGEAGGFSPALEAASYVTGKGKSFPVSEDEHPSKYVRPAMEWLIEQAAGGKDPRLASRRTIANNADIEALRREVQRYIEVSLESGRPMFLDELTDGSSYEDYQWVHTIARKLSELAAAEGGEHIASRRTTGVYDAWRVGAMEKLLSPSPDFSGLTVYESLRSGEDLYVEFDGGWGYEAIVEEDAESGRRLEIVVWRPGARDRPERFAVAVDEDDAIAIVKGEMALESTASRRTAEMDDMDLVDTWLLSIGLGLFGEDSYTDAADARAAGESDCRATVEAEGLQPTEVEDVMYAARRRATEADEAGIPLMVSYWEGVASCAQSAAGA